MQTSDPDALYAHRDDLASSRAAERIWADRLARNPKDFESAWKLARARYSLGTHAPENERKAILKTGIDAGRVAIAAAPNRPEGHFWTAANMGALAESFGLRQGLKYRGAIKDELEAVLRLDPAYLQGSADRALGRWYFKVPGLFGGSLRKSEEHPLAHVQPEFRGVAVLSGGDPRGRGQEGRGAGGAAKAPRRADRSRLGAGGSGV
ncbi:MAG: hypothetical protein DMF86_25570 [Acidobacteria bacterium]|nr:MAG: hypothetical protein DMF86_25570 [Acidobacteriota bacterium]